MDNCYPRPCSKPGKKLFILFIQKKSCQSDIKIRDNKGDLRGTDIRLKVSRAWPAALILRFLKRNTPRNSVLLIIIILYTDFRSEAPIFKDFFALRIFRWSTFLNQSVCLCVFVCIFVRRSCPDPLFDYFQIE